MRVISRALLWGSIGWTAHLAFSLAALQAAASFWVVAGSLSALTASAWLLWGLPESEQAKLWRNRLEYLASQPLRNGHRPGLSARRERTAPYRVPRR